MGKGKFIRKFLIALLSLALLVGLTFGYFAYEGVYSSNVSLGGEKESYFYIHTGADVQDVIDSLYHKGYILNRNTFEWVLKQKNYTNHVKAGRYPIKTGMSNNDLINMLRSGDQEPVKLTINNIRTPEELASLVGKKLECNGDELYAKMMSQDIAEEYGYDLESFRTMFLPNTYEFYWNTSADEFIDAMARASNEFWSGDRLERASRAGLSKEEVIVLASIVESEQNQKYEEQPKIAGVYINRLEEGMTLGCDPTIIWAHQDFTIQRVTAEMLQIESPYNTYKYTGLPPGPIRYPSTRTVEAVLNFEEHDYLFFCAREDFSGYHNFAKSFEQHQVYARRYQNELTKRRIFR